MAQFDLKLGDCIEIMKTMDLSRVKLLLADPPYGKDIKTDYNARGRTALAECSDYAQIVGDNNPFDPTPFLGFPIVVLFGANYYADKLPISGGWIVWDKLNGLESKRTWGFNDNSDCELIWTNVGDAARILRHRWMGAMKESERGERRVHPTQRPIELMKKIIEHYTSPGDVVLDPYAGSGPVGVACMQTGRDYIGMEISEHNFEIAKTRIATERLRVQLQMGEKS